MRVIAMKEILNFIYLPATAGFCWGVTQEIVFKQTGGLKAFQLSWCVCGLRLKPVEELIYSSSMLIDSTDTGQFQEDNPDLHIKNLAHTSVPSEAPAVTTVLFTLRLNAGSWEFYNVYLVNISNVVRSSAKRPRSSLLLTLLKRTCYAAYPPSNSAT